MAVRLHISLEDQVVAELDRRARLGTGNPKDFPMAGLQVDHWPVGG